LDSIATPHPAGSGQRRRQKSTSVYILVKSDYRFRDTYGPRVLTDYIYYNTAGGTRGDILNEQPSKSKMTATT